MKHTLDYTIADASSNRAGESNDCSIKAIAIATNTEYEFVRGFASGKGRTPGEATPWSVALETLYWLGYCLNPISLSHVRGKTLGTVAKQLDKTGVFLLRTDNHLSCVYRGRLEDYRNCTRKVVSEIWAVRKAQCSNCGKAGNLWYHKPPPDWNSLSPTLKKLAITSYWINDIADKGSLCRECALRIWGCAECDLCRVVFHSYERQNDV